MPSRPLVGVVFALVLATGCGGGSSPSAPTPAPSTTTPTTPTTPTALTADSLKGDYTLTLGNAPTCPTLTASTAVGMIATSLGPIGGFAIGIFDRTPLQSGITVGGMTGTTSGTTITSNIDIIYDGDLAVPRNSTVWRAKGQMTASVSGTTISGTLNGMFGASYNGCVATNHTITLTKR
jgi:hypothetical protein